jgi:hypothetical protein
MKFQPLAAGIPTAESLKLTSRAEALSSDPALPQSVIQESKLARDDWMLDPGDSKLSEHMLLAGQAPAGVDGFTEGFGDASGNQRATNGGIDFFSSLGAERTRKPRPEAPDPEKVGLPFRNASPSKNLMLLPIDED